MFFFFGKIIYNYSLSCLPVVLIHSFHFELQSDVDDYRVVERVGAPGYCEKQVYDILYGQAMLS